MSSIPRSASAQLLLDADALNIENLMRAARVKRSESVTELKSPMVEMLAAMSERGEASGLFRSGVDPALLDSVCFAIGGNPGQVAGQEMDTVNILAAEVRPNSEPSPTLVPGNTAVPLVADLDPPEPDQSVFSACRHHSPLKKPLLDVRPLAS